MEMTMQARERPGSNPGGPPDRATGARAAFATGRSGIMKRMNGWWAGVLAAAVAVTLPGAAHARTLGVEVWTDRGDDAVYQAGDEMQVKVRASDDAYLLVYEIDSDGRVSVLYPWRRGSNLVEGHRTYRLPPEGSGYELAVEKATGQGYIVAIASRRPFRDLPWYLRPFDPQAESMGYVNQHDDEEGFDEDGDVVGDPMVAMERIRRRVLDRPSDTESFATSYSSYYVGHEVRYPRYLCNDCHRRGHWAWYDGFDPYYAQCSVFDFRVNWNWCWGPCLWSGHTPYYYYVVRSDCPPRYRNWYDDHSRWSSWDGYQAFNNLAGGTLTRYKSDPPPNWTPPPSSKPIWNPGAPLPPGYLPGSGSATRGGFRDPGMGRNRPVDPDAGASPSRPTGSWRNPAVEPPRGGSDTPRGERQPEVRPPRQEQPRQEQPRQEQPRREQPRQEQPRQEQPRREQPRQEQPRQQQPRQEQPKQEQPRHEQPKQEQPKPDRGDHGNRAERGHGR
jgi:hypothetical protein